MFISIASSLFPNEHETIHTKAPTNTGMNSTSDLLHAKIPSAQPYKLPVWHSAVAACVIAYICVYVVRAVQVLSQQQLCHRVTRVQLQTLMTQLHIFLLSTDANLCDCSRMSTYNLCQLQFCCRQFKSHVPYN